VTNAIAGIGDHLRRLVAWALDMLMRWSRRRAGLVLVYHRVGARESREHHLVAALDVGLFETQLDHLKRRYRVVPASELVAAGRARRRGQPLPVAVTFDDDLPSHVHVAMPILLRTGVHAAFFLTGASLSAPFGFWWERLQVAHDRGLLDAAELKEWAGTSRVAADAPGIRSVARAIERMPSERRERIADALLERLGSDPPDVGLRAADVRTLADAGFEIGFHTLRHDPLTQLGDRALNRAMEEGRSDLEALLPEPITMISYPHGKADARVAQAARGAGYRFGFTTVAERLDDHTDPRLVGRAYPSYDSPERFAFEIAVILAGLRR
jgi:peptidoglycan/xylan/chitin deacetylase (PgdA/CDA1 family)